MSEIRLEKITSSVTHLEESHFKISFSDTGKGIPSSDLPKVFDPYFSSKGLGTQKGTGLGLSVVKAVIAYHEGEIAIESTIGKGTTVIVYLPFSDSMMQAIPEQLRSLPSDRPVVLIMEDEPGLQKICKKIIESLGYGVIVSSNALEAINLFQSACEQDIAIKLLVFDQSIKGSRTDGIKALKKIQRAGFKGKSVVMTGSASSPVLSDHKAYGFDGKILKPYTKEDIQKGIESVMGGEP